MKQRRLLVQYLGARVLRAPAFFLVSIPFFICSVGAEAAVTKPAVTPTQRVATARGLVLTGARTGAAALLKETFRDEAAKNPNGETAKMVSQAWREIAEVFLTDRGQSQFSLAESIWFLRPKDATDSLVPLLKSEDGNLSVSRLGARSALRATDCARAETFVQKAEEIYPIGADVKLLRLQLKACVLGIDSKAQEIEIPATLLPAAGGAKKAIDSVDPLDVEPAIRALQLREALRRDDAKSFKSILAAWELRAAQKDGGPKPTDDPEYWYLKWKKSISPTLQDRSLYRAPDRTSGRNYLRLCSEMTPRRRKVLAIHPDLCLHTETVESELKSGEKAGL